ncbi:ABC transporter substrate-binding protein [Synechococcus sp. Nb3U1]|uniref:ABC transporter substrate-binding protein n=1 Tax=Synechococcus sp. Nb3U1 TaxID=1914529 RepID=UPI001F1F3C4C|nr:ABC transporter substrate-binding protein [Synechococcus sp. Nb3U1]MCF2971896.1 ABC transporter substrate-binding protein [Synechococcus sp. Nb3U1]
MSITKSSRRQFIQSAAAAASLVAAGGYGLQAKAQSRGPLLVSQGLAPLKYTLSWLPSSMDTPLVTAILKGYFADNGVEVTYERGFGSADSITKIAAGQYDLGEGDPYSMIEFNAKNPDVPLVAIYVHFNRSPFGIYTLEGRGITEPSQLVGKKLGAPAGDAPRRLWPVFAKQVGIDPGSVDWLTMEPQLREPFLIQGRVDAISGFMTSAMPNIVRGGVNLNDITPFFYNDYGLEMYGNAVITRAELLQEKPEELKGFLNGYVKGWQDTIRDTDGNMFALIDKLKEQGQVLDTTIEKLRLTLAMPRLFVTDEVREIGLGDVVPSRMETSIAQVVDGFGLPTKPALEQVFDGSLLPPKSERMIG